MTQRQRAAEQGKSVRLSGRGEGDGHGQARNADAETSEEGGLG